MTWQDDLRRLDGELASGTISRGEHRRRRDDILAEASGAPPVAPSVAASGAPPTAREGATTPGEDGADQSAPGGWRAENPAHHAPADPAPGTLWDTGSGERTETPQARADTGPGAAALLAANRRTTAPSPADERPTETLRHVGRDPAAPSVHSFDHPGPRPEGSRRGGLTWLAISIAVLVALGGVIGGAWWLGQDRTPASGTTEPSGADAGAPSGPDDRPGAPSEPALADRLPVLPGSPGTADSTLAVDKGVELGLYPRPSAEILADHGVREVIHRSSSDGETNYFLLVFPAPDADRAARVADRMRELTVGAGFESADDTGEILTGVLDGRRVRGTWYASGDVAVNLWVSLPDPADRAALTDSTRSAVRDLHEVLPPE